MTHIDAHDTKMYFKCRYMRNCTVLENALNCL